MDDRISLRLGALRLARWRGRTRDGAWAASRLRLAGVALDPADARFARDVRVKLGRALRSARIRRGRPVVPTAAMSAPLDEPRSSRRRRIIAAAVAALVVLGALFLYVRSQEPAGSPEGAPPSQQAVIATPPPPLRGRTQPGVAAPVAIVQVTPAPADGPPATAAPGGSGTGTVGGGTGAGGSGGGTGTGNGRGTPAPTVKPTPAPTPTPTPTPQPTVAPNLVHVRGHVANVYSPFNPIPNACVSIANLNCSGSPHTDANGDFDVWLDAGSSSRWTFTFIMPGYVTNSRTFTLAQVQQSAGDIGTTTLTPK